MWRAERAQSPAVRRAESYENLRFGRAKTMFCEKCGSEIVGSAAFCDKCGAKISVQNAQAGMPQGASLRTGEALGAPGGQANPYVNTGAPQAAGPKTKKKAKKEKIKNNHVKKQKAKKSRLMPVLIAVAAVAVLAAGGVGAKIVYDNMPAQKLERQLMLGKKYLSSLDYTQAKIAYEEAVRIDPKSADAYIALADIYAAENNYDKALSILSRGSAMIDDSRAQSRIQSRINDIQAQADREKEKETKPVQQPTAAASSSTAPAKALMPKSFTVMVDDTIVTETNGAKEFYAYLKTLLGDGTIDIKWIRSEHSGYYDAVGNAFNATDTMPDVVLLSSDYYALYASAGYLWDMTDAWNASKTKNSGRLISTAGSIFDSLKVPGLDGKERMYGFSPYRGNGCCTYVKKTWLQAAGLSVSDVEGKTLTFDQYYDMLKKMQAAKNSIVISSPGYIGSEAPYTNYLPEFYQKAQYTFYKKADGRYVDGFQEQEMQDALTRIQTAVRDGIIDKESVNNSTANTRDKFYADRTGVLTYWAGTWANTLKVNIEVKGLDGTLIALNPIKELGTYVERMAPAWCITTHAENPEGIFEYFIDTMLDGGDVQTAWEYGAKGTHWDTKAEIVTLKGKEDRGKSYTQGQFHMLPSPEKPTSLMQKNHIDYMLVLAKFKSGTDPGAAAMTETAKKNAEFFAANSHIIQAVPYTDAMADNISDINRQRNIIIAAVANGEMSAADGIREYQSKVGSKVDTVLKSLNK